MRQRLELAMVPKGGGGSASYISPLQDLMPEPAVRRGDCRVVTAVRRLSFEVSDLREPIGQRLPPYKVSWRTMPSAQPRPCGAQPSCSGTGRQTGFSSHSLQMACSQRSHAAANSAAKCRVAVAPAFLHCCASATVKRRASVACRASDLVSEADVIEAINEVRTRMPR